MNRQVSHTYNQQQNRNQNQNDLVLDVFMC